MFYTFLIIILPIIATESKVCRSVDVRNTPSHISEFRECRVIDGSLQVVLMEQTDDVTDFENQNFAELYEITGYLIVFRVMNLPSLDLIFPKLASIKGKDLFLGYSLVIYDVPNLEEIGLKHLRNIEKGNVKIDYCPKLCYVNTVNWTALGVSHVSYTESPDCKEKSCPFDCMGSCWNDYICQNRTKNKCDSSCVGCTQDYSSKHCMQCKYFNNSGTCVQNCPETKVTDNYSDECLNVIDCLSKEGSWTIFNNMCVPECPKGSKRNSFGRCIYVKDKICTGMKITNHYELEQMADCIHINGSLEISISGTLYNDYLERCLGMIVSISEYLKITRSNELTSLKFLKRLKTIKGKELWSKYYALYVVENQNLQELWDFDQNSTLKIKSGTVIFQDNPHLCSNKVEKFLNGTRIITSKETPYAFNNGYQTSCTTKEMKIFFKEVNSTNVTLSWEKFDPKEIYGYTVYYTNVVENETLLKLKDGYIDTEDSWGSVFVRNNTALVKRLNPFTHYGFYIKTHFLLSFENEQTPLHYFQTLPDDPSDPVDLKAESKTDTMIDITWKAPIYLSGELSHYKLGIYIQRDYIPMITQRNYCIHPFLQNGCTCLKKDEIQIFLPHTTCIGDNTDHYCNNKTVYHVTDVSKNEAPKEFKIKKRSITYNESGNATKEFTINATDEDEVTVSVYGLQHFTLYSFYVRACNKKLSENESDHCGGYSTVSQRTLKKENADTVTSLGIQISGEEITVSWPKPETPNSVILAYYLEHKRIDTTNVLKSVCVTTKRYNTLGNETLKLGAGKYLVRVRALSLAGYGDYTKWYYFEIFEREKEKMSWGSVFIIFFGVLISIILGIVIYCRYKSTQSADTTHLMFQNRIIGLNEDDNEWKLDDETVEIIKELEQNSIGMLYRKKGAKIL